MPARVLLALSVLASSAARAQAGEPWLYVNPTLLVSSSRLNALAGASTGIGEGAEGLAGNYAAVAHRNPRREGRWDWSLTFSLATTPFAGWRDFDNDGRGQPSTAPAEAQLGGILQYSQFGAGVFARTSARSTCVDADCAERLRTSETTGGLVAGLTLWEDQLVAGAGIHLTQVTAGAGANGTWVFSGASVGGGALLRLHELPFRIGLQLVTPHRGTLDRGDPSGLLLGRPVFQGTVSPARASLGGSVRLGAERGRYNRVSKALLDELTRPRREVQPYFADHDVAPGTVLLAAQVDVHFPVPEPTTTASPFLLGEAASGAGHRWTVVPRIAVEWEALEHRLRLRLGGWLEPAFAQRGIPRGHATGGAELFLLRLWLDWSLSFSFDVATRYFAGSIGIGFWE